MPASDGGRDAIFDSAMPAAHASCQVIVLGPEEPGAKDASKLVRKLTLELPREGGRALSYRPSVDRPHHRGDGDVRGKGDSPSQKRGNRRLRSEERRVGKECVSTYRTWWSPNQ